MRVFRWIAFFLFLAGAASAADNDPSLLLKAGRADEALRVLNGSLAQNPNDARAYHLLCRVYYQLELWDESVRMAEKSIALDPQNSSYHHWLGRAMGRKAEVANPFTAFNLARKVKTEFERAVALDANNLSARSDLSEFYLEAPSMLGGDKKKARQQADFVTRQDAALGSYILARVEEKQATGRAEAEYKKAVAASPAPSLYWVELAHFYRRAGRLNDMESAVTQSLATARNGDATEFDVANLLLRTGRNFAGARQMLQHYIVRDNASEDGPVFQAHYLMGTLLERQGRSKEAAQEFQAALNMASQYKPARDALARVSR
ncbi:MAG TPA: tetratricopeptide repeat protein [Candidatus Sulfotelmatobacter sp.]|nr:tetratricopeptide repeat protein [Candidatus Sulfotelmatobacter sp.]